MSRWLDAIDDDRGAAKIAKNPKNGISEHVTVNEQADPGNFGDFGNFGAPMADADFEERAALVEYGAGVPREWAEGFALLHPDRPPAGIAGDRWRRFVDVVGMFLDRGYAAQAAALGWNAVDVFGCDATKPAVCVDLQGLCWLIPEGARLVTLTENAATIRLSTGSIQTFRRMSPRGAVLAWELVAPGSVADGMGNKEATT